MVISIESFFEQPPEVAVKTILVVCGLDVALRSVSEINSVGLPLPDKGIPVTELLVRVQLMIVPGMFFGSEALMLTKDPEQKLFPFAESEIPGTGFTRI